LGYASCCACINQILEDLRTQHNIHCFSHACDSIRGRIFVCAKIRTGSKLKRFLRVVVIDVSCPTPAILELYCTRQVLKQGWISLNTNIFSDSVHNSVCKPCSKVSPFIAPCHEHQVLSSVTLWSPLSESYSEQRCCLCNVPQSQATRRCEPAVV
jgi:hypothetical protein